MTNKEIIWHFFKSVGLTDAGTAGLMGNLEAESGFNPQHLEDSFNESLGFTDEAYTNAVDNGEYDNFSVDGAGYGIAQWNYYTKKLALLSYSKIEDKSVGDIEVQLKFLKKDMQKSFNKLWEFLKKTNNVYEATAEVLTKYEVPKDQSEMMKNKRYEFAKAIYKEFVGKAAPSNNTILKNNFAMQQATAEINNPQYINGIASEVVNGIWGNRWRETLIWKVEQAINEIHTNASIEKYYKVVAGDTLTKIANRFNTTIEKIISDNQAIYPSIAKSYLNVGWTLKI